VLVAVHVQERATAHHLVVEDARAPRPALGEILLVTEDRARDEHVADGDAQARYADDSPDPPQKLDQDEDDRMRGEVERELVPAGVPARQALRPLQAARYRCAVRVGSDRILFAIAALVFVDTFGYAIVLPLLPFAAEREGAPPIVIGAVFATYSLCQLFAAPVLGTISDRVGRKPVLVLSLAGSAAGFLLLAASGSLFPMFVSRVVDGATAGNISTAYAVILDRFRREEWAARFAMLGSATGAGIVFGLLTSSLLASGGLRAGALVAFVLATLTAVATYVLLPETRRVGGPTQDRTPLREAFATGGPSSLRRTVAAALVSMVMQAAFLVALPLYLLRTLGYTEQSATIFLTVLVGGAAVFQLGLLPQLLRVAGERRAALLGFVLVALGGVTCAIATNLVFAALGAALAMAAVVILNPAFTSLIGQRREAAGEGTLMGINQSTASLGQLLGPLLGYAALGIGGGPAFGLLLLMLGIGGAVATIRLAT
jgi:DHA1 family tetracycline resistance protein-like MFS transporter